MGKTEPSQIAIYVDRACCCLADDVLPRADIPSDTAQALHMRLHTFATNSLIDPENLILEEQTIVNFCAQLSNNTEATPTQIVNALMSQIEYYVLRSQPDLEICQKVRQAVQDILQLKNSMHIPETMDPSIQTACLIIKETIFPLVKADAKKLETAFNRKITSFLQKSTNQNTHDLDYHEKAVLNVLESIKNETDDKYIQRILILAFTQHFLLPLIPPKATEAVYRETADIIPPLFQCKAIIQKAKLPPAESQDLIDKVERFATKMYSSKIEVEELDSEEKAVILFLREQLSEKRYPSEVRGKVIAGVLSKLLAIELAPESREKLYSAASQVQRAHIIEELEDLLWHSYEGRNLEGQEKRYAYAKISLIKRLVNDALLATSDNEQMRESLDEDIVKHFPKEDGSSEKRLPHALTPKIYSLLHDLRDPSGLLDTVLNDPNMRCALDSYFELKAKSLPSGG